MAQLSFLKYLGGIYKLNLNASTVVHNAIIQAIYDCFVMAKGDVDAMRLELCLTSASGVWLDYWGGFFSVYRKADESDYDYQKRIIASVIQPKSTIPAVKDNIVTFLNTTYQTEYTTEDVSITEPWTQVAKYSHKGTLSNSTRFCSGDYYSHAVIDIAVPEDITQELIDLVNSVKAAGVKVIWSVLNSYEITTDFSDVNEAWAYYTRHIQTHTERKQHGGLILSNSSPQQKLSGTREIWNLITNQYMWYAVVQKRNTDESITINKKDLIGVLDYYKEVEKVISINTDDNFTINKNGRLNSSKLLSGSETEVEYVDKFIKISEEMLQSLELMDELLTLDLTQRLNTSDGILFKYTSSHELFGKLMKSVADWKEENQEYYQELQSPIENGDRVMWYLERDENWIWNTPTMTHEDFFNLWEPFGDYEEHTINSIIDFEDACEKGFITFADVYQPPIVRTRERFLYQQLDYKPWLWGSYTLVNGGLEQIFQRQFDVTDDGDRPNPTLAELMDLEENYNKEGYSVDRDHQGLIDVVSKKLQSCEGLVLNVGMLQFTDECIGTRTRLYYNLMPSTTTDKVTFISSNPDVVYVDEDGLMYYRGVGICNITVSCGDYESYLQVVITKTIKPEVPVEPDEPTPDEPDIPTPDEPDVPQDINIINGYLPAGLSFTSYSGEFNIDNQTLYADVSLDNTVRSLQDVLSIGTGIDTETSGFNIHMMYPKEETITEDVIDIDTSDNFVVGVGTLSGGCFMSGSEFSMRTEYIKHEIDIKNVVTIDVNDNLTLSSKKTTVEETGETITLSGALSASQKLSGSEYNVERIETILIPTNIAEFTINSGDKSVTVDTDLGDNTARIALNSNGYYINGKAIDTIDPELSQMLLAVFETIRAAGTIQVGSTTGDSRSYAKYNEIKIMNKLLTENEMIEMTG